MNEKERFFNQRTKFHISLVCKAAKILANLHPDMVGLPGIAKKHDDSKFGKNERAAYIELTWRLKTGDNSTTYEIDAAVNRHIHTNLHHPEAWIWAGKSVADMTDDYVAEMVCDWWAMSQELGTNTPRQWFWSEAAKKFPFSSRQKTLILKLIGLLEKAGKKGAPS